MEMFGNSGAQQDRINIVTLRFVLILIEREQDQGTIFTFARVETLVLEQGDEPPLEPGAQEIDGGIMTIVHHVWCEEHPLR